MTEESVSVPKPKKTYLILAVLIAVFFILYFSGVTYFENRIYTPVTLEKIPERVFEVKAGDSVDKISRELEKENLISSGFIFKLYVKRENWEDSLQAGKYMLSPNMSIADIAMKMSSGNVFFGMIRLTIPEGFTLEEIDGRVRGLAFEKLNGKSFSDFQIKDFQGKYEFLKNVYGEASLEGFLFPDTYDFKKDVEMDFMIDAMLANFDKKFSIDMRQETEKQGKTIFDIVIMASILEKEVKTEEDMEVASGILWKRLEIGMPLQVDASVIYALKRNEITKEDLKTDSPYNTYLYKGLPKGPISNPGKQALLAAIYPKKSEFLYYISKKTGETVFSKTFSEHQKAVNQYLK